MCAQVDGGATPGWAPGETPAVGATPSKRGRSRWDETPANVGAGLGGATPMLSQAAMLGQTPVMTPMGGMDMPTPSPSSLPKQALTAEQYQVLWALHPLICMCYGLLTCLSNIFRLSACSMVCAQLTIHQGSVLRQCYCDRVSKAVCCHGC